MTGRAVYIAIIIGFFRRLLRKVMVPAGKHRAFALYIVVYGDYYAVPGTVRDMTDGLACLVSGAVIDAWGDCCDKAIPSMRLQVLPIGRHYRPLCELEDRLDDAEKASLRCIVNGARATYNDVWRWNK